MSEYQDILNSASQLPIDDRLRLIDDLASAVPDDQSNSKTVSVKHLQEAAGPAVKKLLATINGKPETGRKRKRH